MTRRAMLLASVGLGLVANLPGRLAARFTSFSPRPQKGLREPVEILEDRFGIPHVRANSVHDAYWAQGYLVARDRLFQLDLDLRRDLGRMAEAFGPSFLPADRAARLFHYRGDLKAELATIPSDVVDAVRGYCAGINARIDEIAAAPELAPREYGILGIAPLRWTLEDCVRRRGAGSDDADEEIRRAMLAARGLIDLEHWREPLRLDWDFTVPEELDCAAVSRDDLGALRDLDRPPAIEPALVARIDGALGRQLDREGRRIDLAAQGSNAWTVAGSRTASGRPILANDPHLAIGGFSPRHIVHLTAPGLDVIGAGYPGLPGIMQGHTDRFAFGRTNFHIDQTDLFVLETHPDDPDLYRRNGEWTPFDLVEDTIAVAGGPSERVTLRFAQGRAVIAQDRARHRAIAFATVTMLPGANMRFAIVAINLAKDWDGLRKAFRLHVSPTNLHYADIDGNTGWHAIGFAPVRPRHDGLFPAPGDGSFDWTGVMEVDEMPSVFNPASGRIISANAMNLPKDYPFAERILSFTWSDPFRHDRIDDVLAGQESHSLDDSVALLHDSFAIPAARLIALLPENPAPEAREAAAMLAGWNGDLDAESGPALLYEMVIAALSERFHAAIVPPEARDLISRVNLDAMLRALASLDSRLGNDPAGARRSLIEGALVDGWANAVEHAGTDPSQWRWGDLHRVNIAHPLSDIAAIAANFPPIDGGRSGGDGTTVMARGMRSGGGYEVRHGASFLFAADVGNWDRTRFLLLPGQSADPDSPHYRDFYKPWLAGEMMEWSFSRDAVDKAAVTRFTLSPD
ncbi:penicillin acylase family protein [Qipengyuania sp. MTN3-11]|uniref:penicillin acylase family protein n=1 Tax=Qipengyuania sp. MTN3-11 TaxID=3056557 RepID=UPI0036F35837